MGTTCENTAAGRTPTPGRLIDGWTVDRGLCQGLPGPLAVARGTARELDTLLAFHYATRRPATLAGLWVVRYDDPVLGIEPVACVAVSYPTPRCTARESAFGLATLAPRDRLTWLNRNLRTISRLIVHPRFRGLSLASTLVRHAVAQTQARHIESIARMGQIHPVLIACGFATDGQGYFWKHADALKDTPPDAPNPNRQTKGGGSPDAMPRT